jgi:NADH-quinone oxidoreductase subunit N
MIPLIVTTIPIHVTAADYGAVLPELVVAAGVLLMLLLDVFVPRSRRLQVTTATSLLVVLVSFVATLHLWTAGSASAFYGTMTSDRFAVFFDAIILLAAALAVLLSPSYIAVSEFDPGEFYALLLASAVGMMLMAGGTSFMLLFLALELLSLSLYILSGFERSRPRSQEAGFKYFLLSSFASSFLLYGMALVYGATGSTQLRVINFCLHGLGCASSVASSPLLFIGIGLMVVGFAFKVSIVPFHMWTPDVYEGAPTPVTAFMSVTTKAAVFAAFVRVFNFSLSGVESHWYGLIWALAIATMIVGNVMALTQTNMKRLLAYSGIAHAGYILVAMAANNPAGITAIAFYFLVYTFMNIGAFIIVSVLESQGETGDQISTYRGLWQRNPELAGATAVFMFSLAGFPPTAGFFAKYLAFSAVVQAGHTELAIVGVLTSLVSIFYYLRVVVVMFMQPEGAEKQTGSIPAAAQWAIGATLAGTIGLGIIPTGFFNYASQSVDAMRAVFGLP